LSLSRRRFLAYGAATLVAGSAFGAAAADDEPLWELLRRGGLFLFMRHGNAPGGGDPPDMRIDDCSTQRNLSDLGRSQAKAIGEEFRRRGIDIASVQSSRWCRCLETARLAFGRVEPLELLNSFIATPERTEPQTAALRDYLAALPPTAGNRVFVSHFGNINALLGTGTGDANIHLARREGAALDRLGTLAPP
jgi:broad specificity phosphatase PhoE